MKRIVTAREQVEMLSPWRIAMPIDPYTGPPMAEPSSRRPRMQQSFAYNWKMPTFYHNKQFIQEGVEDALKNGYEGMTDARWRTVRRHLRMLEDGWGEMTPGQQEALRYQGRELAAQILRSEPTTIPLYRGVMLHPDDIARIVKGQQVSLPASSFDPHQSAAMGFAGDHRHTGWTDFDEKQYPPEFQGVVFQLEPGAQAAKIPDLYGAADEYASLGTYDIVDVKPGRMLKNEPTGSALCDGYDENGKMKLTPIKEDWFEPHIVTLRHRSLSSASPQSLSQKVAATDVDEIMDLLGISSSPRPVAPEPEPEPPIPGIPPGEERYYKWCKSQPDVSHTAHMMMPTNLVDYYKEYDRSADDTQSQVLERVMREHGKIRNPLLISTDGTHALLHEGNHRLALAKKLGISHIPIRVQYDKEVRANDGTPVPLDPTLKAWVEKNKDVLLAER